MSDRGTLVVVSPHLDDAVLSCAGAIASHAKAGERVIVVTVFSAGRDAERRREEDHAALAILGAEALHLGLLDAPERLDLPRTHRALVEESAISAADLASVRSALASALNSVHNARIMVPLGVGEHVDHRVVHAALCDRPAITFYEERPYAFLAGALHARTSALGIRVDGVDPAPSVAAARDQIASLPHLVTYLAADEDGERARTWLASRVSTSKARALLTELHAESTSYDDDVAALAAQSIALYRSEVAALFGSESQIAPSLRAASAALASRAAHAERVFRAPQR